MSCVHQPSPNPRDASCVKCGKMPQAWEITEALKDEFFSSLRSALNDSGHDRDATDAAILHARQRLQKWAGHPYAYLSHENTLEAMEEAADGPNYALFEGLVLERDEYSGEIDGDTADEIRNAMLNGAFHCALAHALFSEARRLRKAAEKQPRALAA